MNLTASVRTLVRPVVTFALTGAGIVAAFHFNNPEFIYSTVGPVIGFWFADRAKEREQQSLAYGAAQDRSMIAANKANIDLIQAQQKSVTPAKPIEADALKRPLGYVTPS